MRWAVSLVLLAIVATAAYPLLRGLRAVVDGRSADSRDAPLATAIPDREPRPLRVIPSEVVVVYRWRDARGTVHFETEPPPDGVEAEIIEMRRPARAVPIETAEPEPERTAPLEEPFSVYTPDGTDELLRRLDGTLDSLGERERTMRELEKDL